MQHTTFGRRTGLRVSELALGTSNFGTGWATGADHATSSAIFTAFAEAGGTFIDTADTYQHCPPLVINAGGWSPPSSATFPRPLLRGVGTLEKTIAIPARRIHDRHPTAAEEDT